MTSKNDKKTTLTDDEIVTAKSVSRRSTLGIIGVSVVGAAVGAAVALRGNNAQAQTAPNDSDSGPSADRPGHGATGHSDRDAGAHEDRPNHGVCALRGITDHDSGNGADGPSQGRGPCHQ